MIIKLTLWRWRFTFSMAPITKVTGINSTLKDGNHILMWDFDNIPIELVKGALKDVQIKFRLPTIRIASSGRKNGYLAICLCRVIWRHAVEILAATRFLDWNYLKYGIYRGHFTIRITPKAFLRITYHSKLQSPIPEGVSLKELNSLVQYETLEPTWKSRKLEIKLFAEEA